MRNTEYIIKLLLYLYNHTIWDDMEEYFSAAEGILNYHGAKWINIEDVKGNIREAIFNNESDDRNSKYYGVNRGYWNVKFQSHMESLFDNSEELNRLEKYLDSEEGFREELNMCKSYHDQAGVFYKFITFKNNQ